MGRIMGGGQQRTESRNDPWEPAQPYYKDIMSQAQNWFNGEPARFYDGPANAPLTPFMQDVIAQMGGRGMQGSAVGNAAQNTAAAIAGGNLVGSNPAFNFLQGTVNASPGQLNPALGYAQQLAGNVGNNPALQYLNAEASGANMGNPWLDAQYGKAAQNLVGQFRETEVPAIRSDYALSGRYGSNAAARALGNAQAKVGDQLTNLATGIYGGAYDADRNRQAQAAQALTGAYQQDVQAKLGAGGFLSGIYDQGLQRQLYGSQLLGQLGQNDVGNMLQAAQLAPSLAGMDWQDLGQAFNAANYGQQRAQGEQDLARQRWDYEQNQPFNRLQQYAALINGVPLQGYGTTTTTTQQPGGGLGSMLGAGLSLGSMFMGIPTGAGSMFGTLFGGGAGGAGSGLGSMMGAMY